MASRSALNSGRLRPVGVFMVSLREAKIEDAETLAAAERAITETPGFLASRPHEVKDDAFRKKIEAISKIENGKYIVAEDGGKIVGHAFLEPMGLEAIRHVVRLTIAVYPGSQGRGIGKEMLSHLIEWAKTAPGVEKIELNVRSVNEKAIQLYQQLGFRIEGRIRKRMRFPNGEYVDDLEMGLLVQQTNVAQANRTPEQAIEVARSLALSRYPSAEVIFCAGSILRGEGTDTSDIDLVVILPKVENAWRESLVFKGWPVEAFVHDPETLHYFFLEVDAKSGVPSLPQMVMEGKLVLGNPERAKQFKGIADQIIQAGPAALSEEDIRNRLYGITDLIEDLRAPKSRDELIGAATRLYDLLADFALRSKGHWSGDGKQISRALNKYRPDIYHRFTRAFDELFIHESTDTVVSFAEELVAPFGGFIFDGYRRDAPVSWRLPLGDAL